MDVRLLTAGVAAASLVTASPALADHGKGNRNAHPAPSAPSAPAAQSHTATLSVLGVVQSVSGSGVSVKRLDGSSVTVPVERNTRVTIDGKPARLTDVRPGFVLSATWQAGKPATTLRFVRPT